MKNRIMLLIVALLAAWQGASSQDKDTVWTKNIWPEEVAGVLFSPDGSQIYVSTNQRVWIISTLTGDSIRTVSNVGSFKFQSKDDKFIYTYSLRKLDAQTYAEVAKFDTIPTNDFRIGGMALTGDGKTLVVTSHSDHWDNTPPYAHFFDDIALFNADNMKFDRFIDYPPNERIYNIAASPDGKFFVILTKDCSQWWPHLFEKGCNYKLVLWDAKTNQIIKAIYQDTLPINVFKFTPDSKYLAAGIGVQVWFFETENFQIKNKIDPLAKTFSFTLDGKYLISGNDRTRIWNIETNKLVYQYNVFDSALSADIACGFHGVESSNDEKYILSACSFYLSLLIGRFDPTEIYENPRRNATYTIYPNPINGNATISFNNTIPGNIVIDIINEQGIKILNLYSGFLQNVKSEFHWNTIPYPNGTYFSRITGNGINLTYKIIIAK